MTTRGKGKQAQPAKATVAAPAKAARKPAAPPAPKVSKDELRAQVKKLETLVATLRAKSRETNKTAKAAALQIATLEDHVAQFEKQAAATPAPVAPAKAEKPVRAKRQRREIATDAEAAPSAADQAPAAGTTETEPAPGDDAPGHD